MHAVQLKLPLPPRKALPYDVVTVGLNSIDLLVQVAAHPAPNSKQPLLGFARLPGGQAATAAVTCARQGWRARYLGTFGDDDHGRLARKSLEAEGVDVTRCRTVQNAPNQFAVILVDEKTGDRTVLWHRAAGLRLRSDDVPQDAVCSGRVLLVDCHETEAVTDAARLARASGIPTVIDVEHVRPGIHELLREIDVIIAAEGFPSALTGARSTADALRILEEEFRPALACVTLGQEGSLARAEGREIRTAGFRVPCVDTTGAGDVFRGALVAAWLASEGRNQPNQVEDILRYANAVAALKCRALGAREGIPSRAETEEFLSSL